MSSFYEKIKFLIDSNNWKGFVSEIKKDPFAVKESIKEKKILKTARYDFNHRKSLKIISCLVFQDEKDYSETKIESKLDTLQDDYFTSFFHAIKISKKRNVFENYKKIKRVIDNNNNLLRFFELTESVFCEIVSLPSLIPSKEILAEIFNLFFSTSTKKEINVFNEKHSIDNDLLDAALSVVNQMYIENFITLLEGTIEKIEGKLLLKDRSGKLTSIQLECFQFDLQRFKLYKQYIENNTTRLPHSLLQKFPSGNYGIAIPSGRNIEIMKLLQKTIYSTVFTPEEIAYIQELHHELHLGNYFKSNFILKTYSPLDLLYFRRIFFLIYIDFKDNLYTNKEISLFEKIHSIPLRVKQNKFEQFLRILLKKDFTPLLKALCIDTQNMPSHIDIQYTPFILNNDLYAIPLGIFVNSNFIRNAMIQTKSHIEDLPGNPDVIDEEYQNFFPNKISGLSYTFNGKAGELDTMFKVDNTIFISENKNPIFGTSFLERQNTFDYANYAQDQRKRFLSLWNDKITKVNNETFLDYFNKKIISHCNKKRIKVPFLADTSTEIVFFCTMGNRSAIHLSSNNLHIIFIRQMISFLDNQPVIFLGKKIFRPQSNQNNGLLSNKISSDLLKSFIHASDYKNIGNYFFSKVQIKKQRNLPQE